MDEIMSVGVIRVAKMKSGSVKKIEIHDYRENNFNYVHKDIDSHYTGQNYALYSQNCSFNQSIKKRIAQLNLPRAVRKDAIVMVQVLVTSDCDFFSNLAKEQQKQFFEDSYYFLSERYGKENIISATVHLDEKTPHMHFNFVPVTSDGRLSAKSVLTRQNLIEQHTAFYEQVGQKYGLNRGQTKEERIKQGNHQKNMTMPEYKAYMAELNQMRERAEILESELKTLREQKKLLENQIEGLQSDLKAKELAINEILKIQPQKTLTGALKGITVEDIKNLKKTAMEAQKAKTELDRIRKEDKHLMELVLSVKEHLAKNDTETQVNEVTKQFEQFRKKVERVVRGLSKQAQIEFGTLWKMDENFSS